MRCEAHIRPPNLCAELLDLSTDLVTLCLFGPDLSLHDIQAVLHLGHLLSDSGQLRQISQSDPSETRSLYDRFALSVSARLDICYGPLTLSFALHHVTCSHTVCAATRWPSAVQCASSSKYVLPSAWALRKAGTGLIQSRRAATQLSSA